MSHARAVFKYIKGNHSVVEATAAGFAACSAANRQQPRDVGLRRRQGSPQRVGAAVVLQRGGQGLRSGHEVQLHRPPGRQALPLTLLVTAAAAVVLERSPQRRWQRPRSCSRHRVQLGYKLNDEPLGMYAPWFL